jgi:hypothetical protein
MAGSRFLSAGTDTLKVVPDTTDLNSYNNVEKLFENSMEDTEDSKLLDKIDYMKDNPVELNSASLSDLEEIPFMTTIIAKKIIDYRAKNRFKSKRELLKIEGITDDFYDKIKVFVFARNSKTDYVKDESGYVTNESSTRASNLFNNLDIRLRSRVQQDLQTRAGFLNGQYPGSKQKVYNRLTGIYTGKDYQLGSNVTLEKDAGETNYADFSSAYFELKNWKFVKRAVVGDYVLNFGQGLGLRTSLSYSKGSEAVSVVKKDDHAIESYRSTNEVQFFRGAATNISYKNYDFYVFYSNNYFDASVDTTLNEVSSFYFEGYHRTLSEQNRQNSGKEKFAGGRVLADYGFLRLGATYWNSTFSKTITADSSRQLYNFSGNSANMMSVDYDVVYKNINFFGEVARSQASSVAGLGAVQVNFQGFADLIILYRNYPENFTPVHSFGFGENNGNTQNEVGFYTGLTLRPIKGLVLNTYFDQFKFPYRSYFNPVPTSGNDFLATVEYKVNRNLTLNFKYRDKNKEESRTIQDEFGRDVKKIDNRNQMNFRIGFDYDISKSVRTRTRYEYVMVKYDDYGGNNKGYLFYSDLKASLMKNLSASTRFMVFQTEDYDSRVYEFEDDLKGVMSNVGLYGNGTRWYVMLAYRPWPYAEINAKYSATYLDGVTAIGTGNDLIQGNINNRLNLGIEISF